MWATCIHEAAHAVVDFALGTGVAEIWVNGEAGGYCQRGATSAVAFLAGTVAEWQLEHPGKQPSADDFRRNLRVGDVRRAVERIGSDDGDLLVAVWLEAKKLIDREWERILLVAEALQQRGRLSGNEVAAILAGRPDPVS